MEAESHSIEINVQGFKWNLSDSDYGTLSVPPKSIGHIALNDPQRRNDHK